MIRWFFCKNPLSIHHIVIFGTYFVIKKDFPRVLKNWLPLDSNRTLIWHCLLDISGLFFDSPLFDVFDRLLLVWLLLWYLSGVFCPAQSNRHEKLKTHFGFGQAKSSCKLIFGQRVCCCDILVVSSVQVSRTPGWSKRGDQTWLSGREEGGRKGYKI